MPAPDLRGAVVLIVDDHRVTLEIFEYVLRAAGATVFCAGSALRGLAILRRVIPTLIVVDIEMPEFDGY
jgi:CheY-like chemotaxis protein